MVCLIAKKRNKRKNNVGYPTHKIGNFTGQQKLERWSA